MLELAREFKRLDSRQKQAVEHSQNTAVLAGPGSGKTATLVLKVAHLLADEVPDFASLACITYNHEAVKELKKRLSEMGIYQGRKLFLGTVHSFCLNCILRPYVGLAFPTFRSGISVVAPKESDALLERALLRTGVNEKVSYLWPTLTRLRRNIICSEDISGYADSDLEVLKEYESSLNKENGVDFESMVGLSVKILEENTWVADLVISRFPWLVIDEYQDLGGPLHHIVKALVDHGSKIFAVGDPDQTIYDFTGADPKYLVALAQRPDFKAIRLKFNYRSGRRLIDASQAALDPDEPRGYEPDPKRQDQGEVFFIAADNTLDDHAAKAIDEVQRAISLGTSLEEIAILYLSRNVLLEELRAALERVGIPYIAERDSAYPSSPVIRWLQDAASWAISGPIESEHIFENLLRFYGTILAAAGEIDGHRISLEWRSRLYEALSETIDEDMKLGAWIDRVISRLEMEELLVSSESHVDDREALNGLVELAASGGSLELTKVLDFASEGRVRGKVVLTTFHSCKGRQFDWVIIPGLVEGILPRWRWNGRRRNYDEPSKKELGETRRLFYVGFTRARKVVTLVTSEAYRNKPGYVVRLGTSRFADEISERLEAQ
jgi:DNA helicase-2/ATP-dependent DNA helicase PcrA